MKWLAYSAERYRQAKSLAEGFVYRGLAIDVTDAFERFETEIDQQLNEWNIA